MASEILNGNDFFLRGNAQVDGSGDVIIEREFNSDYSFALVSRDIFPMNGGNKSVRFVFSASPYKSTVLPNTQGDSSTNRFGYIDPAGTGVILTDIDSTYTTEATEPNTKSVSVSDTHSVIVKNDGTVIGFGDNTEGQINFSGIIGVDMAVAGNDFTAILLKDGTISIIGNDNNGELSVPVEVSSFDEQDKPIKIQAGANFVTVLRKDARVNAWGDNSVGQTDVYDSTYSFVDISSNGLFSLALTVEGVVKAWGGDSTGTISSNTPSSTLHCQYIKAGVNRAIAIDNNGRTFAWGELIATASDGDVDNDTNVILSIPGDKFTITAGRDGTVSSSGSIPQAVLDINGTIGNLRILDVTNPEYENYPILKQSDGLNIVFGIQNENMSPEIDRAVAGDGTILPIIAGRNGNDNVFTGLQGAIKGVALVKAMGNKDVCFELSGAEYDPFTFSGHRPVAENFITTNTEERYEAIVTFSPFGKTIKFRKISGSYANEMPYTVIDLNNVPYDQARIAIYVRGAQDFQLHYAEVTDEIDAALLPAEALFRDMDTAVLQTRAAQSMVDIVNTMKSLRDGLGKATDTIISMGENHKAKITDIEDRITNLGG